MVIKKTTRGGFLNTALTRPSANHAHFWLSSRAAFLMRS